MKMTKEQLKTHLENNMSPDMIGDALELLEQIESGEITTIEQLEPQLRQL